MLCDMNRVSVDRLRELGMPIKVYLHISHIWYAHSGFDFNQLGMPIQILPVFSTIGMPFTIMF